MVVLVSFGDLQFKDNNTMTTWDRIFNEEGLSEEPFVGSIHDYFYDQSYGLLDLRFDLQRIALPDSRRKYRSTDSDDENSKYLVNDITDTLLTRNIDWARYDWNGDGRINQLLIIYAGKGMNDGGDANTIWPHQLSLSEHENSAPRTVGSATATYTIDSYACIQELSGDGSYGSFGTICHEFCHCFGLPDFYSGSTSYVGDWDLMDYGNYNGNGFRPCGFSAYERWFMGWLTPTELTEGATIVGMKALNNDAQAYLIRNDGHRDEYYLIENRQQTGWDELLPGSGIVIAHVDYDEQSWAVEYQPNSSQKSGYTIIPANNAPSLHYSDGWAYPHEGNNELTDGSSPAATLNHANLDGGLRMSKPITRMTVNGGLAAFDFMGGDPAGIHSIVNSPTNPARFDIKELSTVNSVYDLQGRRVANCQLSTVNCQLLKKGVYVVNGKKVVR